MARIPAARSWAASRTLGDTATLLDRCVKGALAAAGLLSLSSSGARALAAIPLGLVVGWRGGLAYHARAAGRSAAEVRRALPFALDRLATCLLAGMSVERALRTIAPRTPGVLGAALTEGLAALDVGLTREDAYRRIAARAGSDDVTSLMHSLARAERFGTSLSDTLVAQAREIRARARSAAEAEARTAPIKLVFPLVFCFLPAFVLLTIAPIAISAIRTLSAA